MAALVGAAETGARTFTATGSQGLAYMHEMMHFAGRGRLPIVMAVVNRTLGAPTQIGAEQDDILSNFNTGWMITFCEHNQEVFDSILLAFRISETVSLPMAVVFEGFTTSSTTEPVLIPSQSQVDRFLPRYRKVKYKLTPDDPRKFFTSPGASPAGLIKTFRQRRRIQEAMDIAKLVTARAYRDFGKIFGRSYDAIECFDTDDADMIIVTTQTMASAARIAVEQSRQSGHKTGLVKIRMYRPFPTEELASVLSRVEKVGVIDRNVAFGHAGVFSLEVKAALCNLPERPIVFGFISGLAGTPVSPSRVIEMLDIMRRSDRPENDQIWIGLESK